MVIRFDNTGGRIGANLRGRIARSGVQDYPTGPELRDPADVFEHASLASLVGVRVQVTHDAGSPTVGYVRGPVRRVLDGEHEFIEAMLEITDPPTRVAAERGDLLELSAGYSTELDPTPGIHNGRRYVARQRRIQFDHVALLPRDQRARCGESCRVHFDSLQPRKVCMSESCSCNRHDVVRETDAEFQARMRRDSRALQGISADAAGSVAPTAPGGMNFDLSGTFAPPRADAVPHQPETDAEFQARMRRDSRASNQGGAFDERTRS